MLCVLVCTCMYALSHPILFLKKWTSFYKGWYEHNTTEGNHSIITKYIHLSNTSIYTSKKHPLGYMFQPNWAIIRPHIWTGSFDYSTFWDPKLFTKVVSQCSVLINILRLKQMLKRQMSIKKIMLVTNSSVPIVTLMCLRLLLKCHTLSACYILLMLAFLWRLFTLGWGVFTLLRFVVFINVFGLRWYVVS